MPSFDSIIVGEDWISEHYFTTDSTKESFQGEVLKRRKMWDEDTKAGHLSALSRFSQHRGELQIRLAALAEDPSGAREAYGLTRTALGFNGAATPFIAERSGTETVIPDVWNGTGGEVIFLESEPADSIEDFLGTGKPLGKVIVDGKEDTEQTTAKLISELYLADAAPKYIVAMAGKWLVLTEQERWAEGRYLAADVLLVADRNDGKKGQEIDRFLATFGRDALMPSPDGTIWWDDILESSVKHTVGVSKDLREGIRRSIEIIANDVLSRRAAQGLALEEVDGQDLARQSLRFLYRILFLLYAEASPELGVLPVGAGEYNEGYGLDRLRELTLVEIHEDRSLRGTHFFESLNVLFERVDNGHNPESCLEGDSAIVSNEGLRFDALKADLFAPKATSLINETKLSNSELQRVLQHLLLSKESRGKDRGFISYAELGINQLGAVYEGLMSYTGFIAETDLHEVAKDGDSSKGSWVVPVDRSESIDAKHFIKERNERTGELETVVHPKGSFVFRLAGRERQQSASYYTPEVLTKFVVSQALEELLDQDGETTPADDILKLTVCEPALGSGAFAIEAVRQLASEYLKRKQDELDIQIPADEYPQELQKVKAQIALHQVHGVDLNSTAVELAEVSLWLDTMTKDLQAPWFGLRLRQGNSLVGARRAIYSRQAVSDKSWLTSAPQDAPLAGLADAMYKGTCDTAIDGKIHHFLLPASGWGSAADAKELKELAGDAQATLKSWRNSVKSKPSKSQLDRLVNLGRRVESLWMFSLRRLQVAEQEAQREINYFGKLEFEGRRPAKAVSRTQIEESLRDPNGAYQRLRRVMDAWNSMWFWPLTQRATFGVKPPTLEQWLSGLEALLGHRESLPKRHWKHGRSQDQVILTASMSWDDLEAAESLDLAIANTSRIDLVLQDHPWLLVCESIAKQQGFFHWELDFAPVFGNDGFDLVIGNPPWVRPTFDEAGLLAEFDPWWQLAEKQSQDVLSLRRRDLFLREEVRSFFIETETERFGGIEFLSSALQFPVLGGLQPDLYRCFMSLSWHLGKVAGLVHKDSHFTDIKATRLRQDSYLRLRRHFHFQNQLGLFEIGSTRIFSVNIYSTCRATPNFLNASWLFHPDTAVRSFRHNGDGELPGIKNDMDQWDVSPHRDRLHYVDEEVLGTWRQLNDKPNTPLLHSRMTYSVTSRVENALRKLVQNRRLRDLKTEISLGFHESGDKKKGLIENRPGHNSRLEDVILQGPHLTVGNPCFKEPNESIRNKNDWSLLDLEDLSEDFQVRTAFQRSTNQERFTSTFGKWRQGSDLPTEYTRVAWREMADPGTVRTLHAALIPPGPTHLQTLVSLGVPGAPPGDIVRIAGFLMSLVADFLVKITGATHMKQHIIGLLPTPDLGVLDCALMLRVLRLNCLTAQYRRTWEESFLPGMKHDNWSEGYRSYASTNLGAVAETWDSRVPLRHELDRRQALLEIDVIVAIMTGLDIDELVAMYRTQFPVLRKYDRTIAYDANGRKVPGDINKIYRLYGENLTIEERTWTHPHSGAEYIFEFPFQSFDREEDMRKAYAHFEQLLAEKQIEELAK